MTDGPYEPPQGWEWIRSELEIVSSLMAKERAILGIIEELEELLSNMEN